MMMGKLRYNVAASLDGFIARPDGSYDWIVEDSSIDFAALFAQFDAFIMGRKTFETMCAQGDQNPLKDRPKDRLAVVTSGGISLPHEVTVLEGTAQAVAWIADAKKRFGRDIWLFGGGALCASLLDEGVVDTFEVAIMPVILGQGIKMVTVAEQNSAKGWRFELAESETLKSGIVMCKYTCSVPRRIGVGPTSQ